MKGRAPSPIKNINSKREMGEKEFNELIEKFMYDEEAFNKFFDFCILNLKRYLKSKLGDKAEVEELAHDIFTIKIYEHTPTKHVNKPHSWLKTMADNFLRTHFKKEGRYVELIDNIDYEPYYEDHMDNERLMDELKKFDKITQQIIILYYWHGMKLDEIADLLHISYANARTKKCRAKKVLKKSVTKFRLE